MRPASPSRFGLASLSTRPDKKNNGIDYPDNHCWSDCDDRHRHLGHLCQQVLELPRTNWAMVGRWIGHIPRGRLFHAPIGASSPVKNELLLGWAFHYLVGLAYAALYFAYVRVVQGSVPTLGSAFVFGLITILSPWFIMQPALGLGICATSAPRPNLVRLQNFIIHSIFGVALYYGWSAANAFGRAAP